MFRIGIGHDTHRLTEGRPLILGGVAVEPWNLIEMKDEGDGVEITASDDAIVLLGHAQPIGEPVFSHGPFVMNTRDEIIQAVQDYQAGKMGHLS